MTRPAPGDTVHYRANDLGCIRSVITGRAGDQVVLQLAEQPGYTLPSQRPDGVVYASLGLPTAAHHYHSIAGCPS